MTRAWIPGFEVHEVDGAGGTLHLEAAGVGDPVVLLHGFPETSLMWRQVAPLLAERFRVVAIDLPGYGLSRAQPDAVMSKRAQAGRIHEGMARLGFARYSLVGHDRGGRIAYRAALDRPDAVMAVAVLDVIPTAEVWERADDRFALAFWPFSLLAQPAPLPELLVTSAPAAVVDSALAEWGSDRDVFSAEVRAAYAQALSDPDQVHAICEEYRAAATTDREHDLDDRRAGRRISAPLLSLWSETGPLGTWYDDDGGPLGIWRAWADDVRGRGVAGGHFFVEEHPAETAGLLAGFLAEALGTSEAAASAK